MINTKLVFRARTKEHLDECMICNRKRLGISKGAVVAIFDPHEPPENAAVYCHACIEGLRAAVRL